MEDKHKSQLKERDYESVDRIHTARDTYECCVFVYSIEISVSVKARQIFNLIKER